MEVYTAYELCILYCIWLRSTGSCRPFFSLGDNIDTAISVARECNMIDQGHKVVMLQATDNGDNQGVKLNYTLVGDEGGLDDPIASYTDSCREMCNDSVKVCFDICLRALLCLLRVMRHPSVLLFHYVYPVFL